MSYKTVNKRKTQLLAVVSIMILIGMGLTILLSPSSGDDGPYLLTLAAGEERIQNVGTPGFTIFDMELQSKFSGHDGVTDIKLEVINKTFFNSHKSHWSFTFLGVTDNTYTVIGHEKVPVSLRVDFLLPGPEDETEYECEKVTFTIGGHNLTSGEENDTHLSPRGGLDSDVEYLTVFTADEINPFWEPSTYADRLSKYLIFDNEYRITLRNLGTVTSTLTIGGWEVWRDVNENGIIDAGDEVKTEFFEVQFEFYPSGTPFDYVILPALGSEELQVTVIADSDRTDVPWGEYLIKISVEADGEDACPFWDILKGCVCDPGDYPEPCVVNIAIGQGWNLVSIGVELDDLGGAYTASTFAAEINEQAGEDIIRYVVRWDTQGLGTGLFQEYVVESGIGTDFPINVGEGYYLFSISPFEMEFMIVGDCPRDETFDLIECWNLVGYRSMTEMDVGLWADLIDEYAGEPIVQAIVRYYKGTDPLPDDDDYDAWYPGDPDDEFQVKPGEAYWIFSATDITGVPYPA